MDKLHLRMKKEHKVSQRCVQLLSRVFGLVLQHKIGIVTLTYITFVVFMCISCPCEVFINFVFQTSRGATFNTEAIYQQHAYTLHQVYLDNCNWLTSLEFLLKMTHGDKHASMRT